MIITVLDLIGIIIIIAQVSGLILFFKADEWFNIDMDNGWGIIGLIILLIAGITYLIICNL